MKKNIHKPYNKLKGSLREKGLTYSDVATTLGISETAVGLKINGKSDFYLSEVESLCARYAFGLENFLSA